MSVLKSSKNPGDQGKLFEFTHGIDVDCFLAKQEIQVQKAWVHELQSIGVLSAAELSQLTQCYDQALKLMLGGTFEWKIQDEDIHMNLERFLVEQVGDLGKKIHLGRSRNDLIATTLRLWISDSLEDLRHPLSEMILTLSDQSQKTASIITAGMTHLQNAQPIRFGHILAAHGWAFYRDLKKITPLQSSTLSTLPLGSAALAGSTLSVDLHRLAADLGFQSATRNSYDSVGDRDFILDALNLISGLGVHLSRIAEDLILWASTAQATLALPIQWSTGSSIMPNKRNPDVPELIRAKSSALIGASHQAHLLMKGLPSSYQSDLHELKRTVIQAFSEAHLCLGILNSFLKEIRIQPEATQTLLKKGHLLATEVANLLAKKGVPFREAYQHVATLVEMAEAQGISIEELSLAEFQKVAPQLTLSDLNHLSYETAVESRSLPGGTSLRSVLSGIETLKTLTEIESISTHSHKKGTP